MNNRIIPIFNIIIIFLCTVILCDCNISAFSINSYAAKNSDTNSLCVYFNPNYGTITSDVYGMKDNVIVNNNDNKKYVQVWTQGKTKSNGLTNASTFGLKRTGYTFVGWGTKSTGGTIFDQNDSSIKAENINIEVKNKNCSTTLYAIWEKNYLTVVYNANGGNINSDTYELKNNIVYKKLNNLQYNQLWQYGATKSGGLVNSGSFGLSKKGYSFAGWSTTESGGKILSQTDETLTAEKINPAVKSKNCTSTLFAIWLPNTLNVYFHANGGAVKSKKYKLINNIICNSDNEKFVQSWIYEKTKSGGLINAASLGLSREGYTFIGWGTKSAGGTVFDQDDKTVTAEQINSAINKKDCSITLYAIWKKNTYSVSYNANGGNGTVKNSVHTYNVKKNLNANTFKRTGYEFKGWATSSGATKAKFADKQQVLNLTNKNNTVVELYAVWEPISYSVMYKANGGKGTMKNSSHTYGKSKALATNKFTRSGYTFVGWSRTKNATTPTYTDKQIVKGLTGVDGKTVVLYAVWQKK